MSTQLRSDTLKKLAMLFMMIDHIGGCILEKLYVNTIDMEFALRLQDINSIFRAIGRLAFPIFCYQAAVGALKTRNRLKHVLLLLTFAFISEIPFDLASEWTPYYPQYQNVIFTILLGTIVIYIMEWFVSLDFYKELSSDSNDAKSKIVYIIVSVLATGTMAYLSEIIHTDYGAKGVILIAIFYFLRDKKYQMEVIGAIVFMISAFVVTYIRSKNIPATVRYVNFEAYACLAFPLMAMDNGIRKGGKLFKWFGYVFYPAHLFIIYLIARIVVR